MIRSEDCGRYRRGVARLGLIALLAAAPARSQAGWQSITTGPAPSPRGFHSLAYDVGRDRTLLFGGWDGTPLGDTWEFDGVSWTRLAPQHAPTPRCCYALAADPLRGRIVLFGGADSSIDWGDTWEWDGADWLQLAPVHAPSPRRQMRATFDWSVGKVVAFGGGLTGAGTPTYGDTWEWDGVDWTQRTVTSSPSARWSAGLAYDVAQGGVLLFGGSPNSPLDTWLGSAATWSALSPTISPSPRDWIQMAGDALRGRVVLFGGWDRVARSDTWVWDGHNWNLDPSPGPSPRAECGVSFDLLRGRMVLFGGYTSAIPSYLGDTWEYAPDDLATWHAFGAGCAGARGVPSLRFAGTDRPVLGRIVQLELRDLDLASPAFIGLGLSDQFAGAVPLPFDLTTLGAPGCMLFTSLDGLIPAAAGATSASVQLSIPAAQALLGLRFYCSGLVLERQSNPVGLVLSNACAATIGSR